MDGTDPVNKLLLAGTIPANKENPYLLTGLGCDQCYAGVDITRNLTSAIQVLTGLGM